MRMCHICSYPETGSEAMQYSEEVPDIAQASSMVVPLHRKRALFTGSTLSSLTFEVLLFGTLIKLC